MKSCDGFINSAAAQYQERVPSLSGGKNVLPSCVSRWSVLKVLEELAFQEGPHSTQRLVSRTPGQVAHGFLQGSILYSSPALRGAKIT